MPLTVRLSLTYLLVTLAGITLLGMGLTALIGRYLEAERERELGAQAEIYAALLGELAGDSADLQALGGGLAGDLLPAGTAVRIFSGAGALLAGDGALGPFPSRAALALVRPPLPLPASQVAGRRYVARAIPGPAGGLGVVELSQSAAADERLLAGLRGLTIQAAAAAGGALAVVSLAVARTIARPVLRLAARADALAAAVGVEGGAASGGPAARPRDEIARLARSLDRLEGALGARMARIGELEQARARFYRSVSHELRTPLTVIRGTLENMADAAPAADRPALQALEGEAARLSRLVDDLLRPPDGGLMLPGEAGRVDLGALAADLCALLEGRARRQGVALAWGGSPGAAVLGDRDRLRQALLNLLDNALRVTPAGGAVRVEVWAAGGLAGASVADSGPGVPAALREQIWERGRRGEGESAGSAGLGLAIVREIVAAHGGRAYLDEGHSPGARFVVELPAAG